MSSKTPPFKDRAAVYVRVSDPRQANGHSLDAQYAEARAYCARHRYRVVRRYTEGGESGLRVDRTAFTRMLDAAERRAFDVIVVWRRDRFGRTPAENELIERYLRTLGIHLEAATVGPQPDTAATRFFNRMTDVASAYESESLGERAMSGKNEAARTGRWPQKPPFGLARATDGSKRLVPCPDAAPLVQEAFRRVAAGQSLQSVARTLGPRHSTISGWIRNPAYLGHLRWMNVRVNDAWEPLVTPATWGRAHATLARTCRRLGRRPRRPRDSTVKNGG